MDPTPARRSRLKLLRLSLMVSTTLTLLACGGGDDTSTATDGAGSGSRATAQSVNVDGYPFFPTAAIPSNANTKGMWSPVYNWPLIPIHALTLPDGRVLSYGTKGDGTQTAYFIYDVWDGTTRPDQAAGHLTLANTTATDIFCSAQILLPTASTPTVFLAGGDNWTGTSTTNTGNRNTTSFDAATNVLSRGPDLALTRWYATTTMLVNGEVYIQGGAGGTAYGEIRSTSGTFRRLGVSTSPLDYYYPRNFVAADGRIFGFDSNGKMYYIDPTGSGSYTEVGQLATSYTGFASSAVMFRPGRILQIGATNSNAAAVIDLGSGGTPTVTPTGSLSQQRIWINSTVLPDGKVLATGGSPIANWYGGANNIAEIWDPQTGNWTQGAAGALARLYHSTALLRPDGSVLVGGGGAPGPLNNTNVEVYYPPYFFTSQGTLAARPRITSAPTVIDIGKTFSVGVSATGGVSRVTLIKTGSVTHSFNMEQRFLELTYQANGSSVSIQAPTRAGNATPGYYMLFVFDAAGVPSVAQIVKINVAGNPNPAVVPTLTNPGAQSSTQSIATSLTLRATDPNGDSLRFAATGLPPGLALDANTGVISGTPSTAGTYNVTATASDGVNVATANFTWSITAPIPLEIDSVVTPGSTVSGNSVTYSATASGNNVRYRWNFGDGSAETNWSSSGSASHAYASPGLYYVTLTITDDTGTVQTRTLLQTVGLPLTARKPTASSQVAVETPASGSARVWVVNPDNGSVSVFDAATRARLGEVATGSAPRTLAVASTGLVWVTNMRSASVAVIDPTSRTVQRKLALARGSMPYGVAMAPSGNLAYVTLQATGQLLKYDSTTYALLGTVDVGMNVRHVSVSADGATVYVSRYITPPLPGESTAAVDTSGDVGGELLAIDAASLTLKRKVVLHHSDVPDTEIAGRGVPNYLGAAAISPDGSQAWVPSKQDNIKRGGLRDGNPLNFQNTVRAISSRVVLSTNTEDLSRRVDHDNASVASAAVFDPSGVYLFVALETSREVAVVNAHSGQQLMRFDTGRAPQGLALSADGRTLYVHNFMDRTLGVYDLSSLLGSGQLSVTLVATLPTVSTEKLPAQVLLGKQYFYDARDTRLARDRYMSCASCHNDGTHDGRVWDLTSQGEGLRNTIALRGRAGGQGFLHWSANFDEVQDFEGQIRALAGGSGLMSDADFNTGTRSSPRGDPKAGISADLDALAAYVGALASFDVSPLRPSKTTLSAAAERGKAAFVKLDCASCHAGTAFTGSGRHLMTNIGTIKPSSGRRLGKTLNGIDTPTLRDVWATAPYLHDGSAPTLADAIRAHDNVSATASDVNALVAYLKEIGADEPEAPQAAGTGTGLTAAYFNNTTLSGTAALTRVDSANFNWGTKRPTTAVASNRFSARWTGYLMAPATGTYVLRTRTDGGVKLVLGTQTLISNWTAHTSTYDVSRPLNLRAGRRYRVTIEYWNPGDSARMNLQWIPPGETKGAAIPVDRLQPQ